MTADPPLKRRAKACRSEMLSLVAGRQPRPQHPSVLVVGPPRCGTTWLMELLASSPGCSPIYEPLRPGSDRRLPTLGKLDGFVDRDDLPHLEQMWRLLERIVDGSRLTHWSGSQTTLRRHLRANRYVVKVIRACQVTQELATRFAACPTIVLRRSAAGFVGSILSSPGPWHRWTGSDLTRLVAADIRRSLPDEPSRVQLLVAWWASQDRAMAQAVDDGLALSVSYDQLRADPFTVLPDLYAYAGLCLPSDLEDRLARPSATASTAFRQRTETDGADPRGGEQRRLLGVAGSPTGVDLHPEVDEMLDLLDLGHGQKIP